MQVIAIAGRNERMRKEVADLPVPDGAKLRAFGFVDNIHELMTVSDLCVTKSGGLTTAECLAMGLPMLIPNPIPGQEERNAEYVTENGCALIARSPGSLKYKVKKFLADPDMRARMQQAARDRARPRAAGEILKAIAGEA